MVDWERVRKDFPVAERFTYFISAGMSPIPNPVLERIVKEYSTINELGDSRWEKDVETYRGLLQKIGKVINTSGDNLAFMNNTSTAMSVLALSLKDNLREDYNVVSMLEEFPSTTVPFEYQKTQMRYVEPVESRYSVETILDKVDEHTVAVSTSYVQYSTGFRQDLERLGAELKNRDVLFFVNATQGFPFYPIDVEKYNIDAMTASLHKWGFVGHIGTMFYTSSSFRKRFPSPIAGWLSIVPPVDDFIHTAKNAPLKLLDSADQYNFGCINFQSINSFETALDYLTEIGFKNIRKRISELTDYLIDGLKERDVEIVSPVETEEERSAIVTFSIGKKSAKFVDYLKEKDVYVSYRAGNVRVSLNIFNNHSDIDLLFNLLDEFS